MPGSLHFAGDGRALRGVFGDEDGHVGLEQEIAAAEFVLDSACRLIGVESAQFDAADHGEIGEAVLSYADVGGKLRRIEDLDIEQIAGADVDRRRVGHRGTLGAMDLRLVFDRVATGVEAVPGASWAKDGGATGGRRALRTSAAGTCMRWDAESAMTRGYSSFSRTP